MTFNKKEIPFYKRLLSYLGPVWIKNEKSVINLQLDILLYRGRFQLATRDALYSDGEYYTPATAVIKELKPFLPSVKTVLVCGTGLGSVVQVMAKKGYKPSYTLVEFDKVVLRLATEYLPSITDAPIRPVWEDARIFMASNQQKFDFLFIDIFDSRRVPTFVTELEFLTQCRNSLNPNGHLSLNYIINDESVWDQVQTNFTTVFPNHYIVENDINRIFITR